MKTMPQKLRGKHEVMELVGKQGTRGWQARRVHKSTDESSAEIVTDLATRHTQETSEEKYKSMSPLLTGDKHSVYEPLLIV